MADCFTYLHLRAGAEGAVRGGDNTGARNEVQAKGHAEARIPWEA